MIKVGAKKGQMNRHLYTILDIANLKSLDFMHFLTPIYTCQIPSFLASSSCVNPARYLHCLIRSPIFMEFFFFLLTLEVYHVLKIFLTFFKKIVDKNVNKVYIMIVDKNVNKNGKEMIEWLILSYLKRG